MKQKEPFKKLTIPNKPPEPVVTPQQIDAIMAEIDEQVDFAMVSLLKELGYEAEEGMTQEEAQELHEKMQEAGEFIHIDTKQEGNYYIVEMRVVQLVKTLKFNLGGDSEK